MEKLVKNVKSKIRYPKLVLLIMSFAFAYLILTEKYFEGLIKPLLDLNYVGAYILGIFFAYGFTSAPAIAVLIKLSNIIGDLPVALIGGLGALTADWLIFSFIRHSFMDEIQELSNEKLFRKFYSMFPKQIAEKIIPVLGGLIIASPLPDEIGVALLASSFSVSSKTFAFMCFVLNTLGIYLFVSIL